LLNRGRFQVRAIKTPLLYKLLDGEVTTQEGLGGGQAVEESWITGDLEAGTLPAGEVAGLIRNIPSARDIVEEMVR
jgi:NAD(P)H-dependent flavin oxidoreductase YrpB (nitropropane dioxygenase family)